MYILRLYFIIILNILLFIGLLGGGCYVNAFYLVSIEINEKDRESSIAIASLADSIGIALAGLTSIPTHNAICNFGSRWEKILEYKSSLIEYLLFWIFIYCA